jgi:hypothetical protein
MNLGEIATEVRTNLKDQRADVLASIQDYINEAYRWVAAETSLPALKSVFTVTTVVSQSYANMPSTFDGRLLYCGTTEGQVNILDAGIQELLELHPDLTVEGAIKDVAVEGSILWYAEIPTTATALICLGYSIPTLLTANTDTPSAIPDYLHREILVNKASEIGYSIIEDGLEGERPNTAFYMARTAKGMTQLESWIEKRKGHVRRSVWSV